MTLSKGWWPLCLEAVLVKLYCAFELHGDLVKIHVLSWSLRFCISYKLLDDVGAA